MKKCILSTVFSLGLLGVSLQAAETYRAECFVPAPKSKTIKYEAKKGPYKIAFVNGYAGNDWRIQAIQSAKAWAARPENKKHIKEIKIFSVGYDSAKQIAAINNFIDAGFDAITFIAVNATAFKRVIRKAKRKGVVLVPFDNILDTKKVVQISVSQFALGDIKARYVMKELNYKAKKILMVNGLPGNSSYRDHRAGMVSILKKYKGLKIIEVDGNWDTGTSQKVVADALATHGRFDGVVSQHGSAGTINAMLAAKHPIVPMGVDGENGVRLLMAKHKIPAISLSQPPAISAIAFDAAIALLQGERLPQNIFLNIPEATTSQLKDGVNYFSTLPKSFNTGTGFKGCAKPFTVKELLAHTTD